MSRRRRRLRGLRLRTRIIALFTLGGFLLSLLLAVTTYGFTRESLLSQRERTSTETAARNAQAMQIFLRGEEPPTNEEIVARLQNLPSSGDSSPLVRLDGEWLVGGEFTSQDLPAELTESTLAAPERMRYRQARGALLAVRVPLPQIDDAAYFEVVPLDELESSLDSLAITLAVAGVVTTAVGAGIGWWASSRVMRPIADVSEAARAIASGRLDTRLEQHHDPDLATIVDSFNEMVASLQARIDRDARFASDVSHELRSPLMTLRASIDVMRGRRDELGERSRAALDLLEHDVERFEALIGDLLEISRLDAGASGMALDRVSAPRFVREAIASTGRDSIPVVVDESAESTLVELDKRRMAQVIANLLDNAENYANGVTGVSVEQKDGQLRINVDDEGPGVPESEKSLIFERFSRGSTAGRRGAGRGSGLGLALVSEHVRLHGGRVWVEDRHDVPNGSRFVVELPVVS